MIILLSRRGDAQGFLFYQEKALVQICTSAFS
jgi:hypothetical protein